MLDATLPLPRYAHGVLGCGPPVLIYPISARETRILIDIPDKVHDRLDNTKAVRAYIHERVAPHVPDCVRPNLRRAIESGRLRSMPNAWMPSTRNLTPGLVILGDASNMRHPVTGGGMTVALKDAILLSNMLNSTDFPSLEDTKTVLGRMGDFHWKRKEYSASLNILAQALYFLFVSEGSYRCHCPLWNRVLIESQIRDSILCSAASFGTFKKERIILPNQPGSWVALWRILSVCFTTSSGLPCTALASIYDRQAI
jgi:squalene monooxygenase